MNLAIEELQRARDELGRASNSGETGFRLQNMLCEPLSRLELAARFVRGVLRRHGRAEKAKDEP